MAAVERDLARSPWTSEQIKELTTAILKGDPEALHVMYQGAKTKAQEFIPHRR